MKLENVRPMLAVNNIDDTILFYRNLLGFVCVNRFEGWAALRRDSVELMISLPNAHEPFEKPVLTGRSISTPPMWMLCGTRSKIEPTWYIRWRVSTMACASSRYATTTVTSSSSARRLATRRRSRRRRLSNFSRPFRDSPIFPRIPGSSCRAIFIRAWRRSIG